MLAPPPPAALEEQEALAVLWEGAEILRRFYVNTGMVTLDAMMDGAIQGMLEQYEVAPYPFLKRLGQIQGPPPPETPVDLEEVWRVWRLLLREHPDVDTVALTQSATRGMVRATGDLSARFLLEEQSQEVHEFIEGTYEGIGAIAQQTEDGQSLVIAIVPGGPSFRAGLRRGDVILAVDGESTGGLSLQRVVQRLRGIEGTQVTIRVQRGGGAPRDIVVTRGKISLPTVAKDVLPGDVGYMWVNRFAETTSQQARDALAILLRVPIRGLVLDLRSNPGGTPEAAVGLVSQFLDGGLVFYVVDNEGQYEEWPVKGIASAAQLPLVVLVNSQTMSAAEIVAGALQDHGRALLFGTTTYGKGSMNVLQALSDGSRLYVQKARWYTPHGRYVQDMGLEPDVVVELRRQDVLQNRDRQLEEAYTYIVSLLAGSEGSK